MRVERAFLAFLMAWSVVSLMNAALNAYAGELPSLTYRGTALGLLLLLATSSECRRQLSPGCVSRIAAGREIIGTVYGALFTAIGLPSVAWRWFAPFDATGLASLRHGALVAFAFGITTLLLVRLLGDVDSRLWRTAKPMT